ncbi:MAG TPA: VOC family protein [Pyrinomonadaceae bacterium]|jgi:catechol 2,3-dioxygenase
MLRGINHVVLKVRNLEDADRFYGKVLGLERVAQRDRMWFYRAGGRHHDLALLEVGAQAVSPGRHQTGLFHFCFDVSDETALAQLYRRCLEEGVAVLGTADHTVMRSFYVRDPDGNVVEFGVDVPREEWSSVAEPFARDKPYALSAIED